MKVQVQNLGPIKHAEIEIRPLTVFVGLNNTGKTLTSYVLTSILGQVGLQEYRRDLDPASPIVIAMQSISQQLISNGNASMDLVAFAEAYGNIYINEVASRSHEWLKLALSTERMSFSDTLVNIDLATMHNDFISDVLGSTSTRRTVINKHGTLLHAVKEKGDRHLYFFTSNEGENQPMDAEGLITDLPETIMSDLINVAILQTIHTAIFRDAIPFPVERTTMITIPIIQTRFADTKAQDTSIEEMTNLKPTSAMVRKFMSMTIAARRRSTSQRLAQIEREPEIKRYLELADIIEQKILGGVVFFSKESAELERDILFQVSRKVSIELPVASSMIKELSPLVLYLRFMARPKDLVVIDEPEMNLHPEAQVKLTEVLAMMAQANLHVLITTHSPYVVDHLTNLIKASRTTNLKRSANKFFLRDQTAFITQDKVSVFLFEDSTAKNILLEDGVIDWDTFGSISSRVSRIFFDL